MSNSSSNSDSHGPKRVLFPSKRTPIPAQISLPNPLPSGDHDTVKGESGVEQARYSIRQPVREYRSKRMEAKVEMVKEVMGSDGDNRCIYCDKEDCPDMYDIVWTRVMFERETNIEDRIHDRSEEEFRRNAERQQIFIEMYWHQQRRYYQTSSWTPEDYP